VPYNGIAVASIERTSFNPSIDSVDDEKFPLVKFGLTDVEVDDWNELELWLDWPDIPVDDVCVVLERLLVAAPE